jgi:dephospho-CoA kinase
MDVVLGNGKVKVKISYTEKRQEIYQRFLAFITPYFLPESDSDDIDLFLNLEAETEFSDEYKALCVNEHVIRVSSAEAFNIKLMRGELPDGTHLAWHERDLTGYAFVQQSKTMTMYASNSSFIHLIEFFRYYMLLIEAGKGSLLLHASAVENVKSGNIIAICGVKGAGKTSTMLNLSRSDQFSYFSGDKVLLDIHQDKLRVRGWPDYPHVGVGSLRQQPELCSRIGLDPSMPPMSLASHRDKYLFTPELFHGALGKPTSQEGGVEVIVLPDVLAETVTINRLSDIEKLSIDEGHLFENPYDFMTASWHGLFTPVLSEPVLDEHQRIRQKLLSEKWLTLTGNVEANAIEEFINAEQQQIKIALVAPSGSGKSTVAKMLKECFQQKGLTVGCEKLAKPLYDLQSQYFSVIGEFTDNETQHQKLLEGIADNLRMLQSKSLVNHLYSRLVGNDDDVIITDDLRDADTDWPALVEQGYVCVRIQSSEANRINRLNDRSDFQSQMTSKLDPSIKSIVTKYTIENNGSINDLENQVELWVTSFLEARYGK